MNVLLVVDIQERFYIPLYTERVLSAVIESSKLFDKVIATSLNDKKIPFKYDELYVRETPELPIEKMFKPDDAITIVGCDTALAIYANTWTLFDLGYNFVIDLQFVYTNSGTLHSLTITKDFKMS